MQLNNNIKNNTADEKQDANHFHNSILPPVKPTPPIMAEKDKKIFLE